MESYDIAAVKFPICHPTNGIKTQKANCMKIKSTNCIKIKSSNNCIIIVMNLFQKLEAEKQTTEDTTNLHWS